MEKGLGHKWHPLEKGPGVGKDRFELRSVSGPPPEDVIAAGKGVWIQFYNSINNNN